MSRSLHQAGAGNFLHRECQYLSRSVLGQQGLLVPLGAAGVHWGRMWGFPCLDGWDLKLWMGCDTLPFPTDGIWGSPQPHGWGVGLSLSPWMGCGALPVPMDRIWGSPCPCGSGGIEPWHGGNVLGIFEASSAGQYGPARSLPPSPWAVGGQGASLGLSNARELQTTPLPSLGHDLGIVFGQWRLGLRSPWSVSHSPGF